MIVLVTSASAWVGPLLFVAAGLIAASGIQKLRRPASTALALRDARWPGNQILVRVLGAAETATGVGCLLAPAWPFVAALALLYAGFAVFLLSVFARGVSLGSCGCLGDRATPPSVLHLVMVVLAAVVGILDLGTPRHGILQVARELPLAGVPFIAGIAVAVVLLTRMLEFLPQLFLSYERRTE
jgi:hypothetical protein